MCRHCMNRREFLGVTAAITAGAAVGATALAGGDEADWGEDLWEPDRAILRIGKPLRVQPVLSYVLPKRREMTSWKSWGGVQSEAAVEEEAGRIKAELDALAASADFPMDVLPVLRAASAEEAAKAPAEADVRIAYPATGSAEMLAAALGEKDGLIFVRHKSGPVYYWYEALSVRQLRTDKDAADCGKRVSVHDVVVDEPQELLWRLRALSAVNNFVGARIVAMGGPQGKYTSNASAFAREQFKLDIVDI